MLRYYKSVKNAHLMLVRVACSALCKFYMQNKHAWSHYPIMRCELVALSLHLSSWFASTMGPTGFWRTRLQVSCYPYICDAHIADILHIHFPKVSPISQHPFGILRSLKRHASKLLSNFGVHRPWTCGLGCMEHQLGSWSNSSARTHSFIVFSGLNPELHLLFVLYGYYSPLGLCKGFQWVPVFSHKGVPNTKKKGALCNFDKLP